MLEIVGFLAATIIILLLAMYGAWRFFLSGDIRSALIEMFGIVNGTDLEVDLERPLPPSDREKLSEVIEAHGEQAKQTMSIQRGNAMATPANRPATATPQPPQVIQANNPATPSAQRQPHSPAVKNIVDNRAPVSQNPVTNAPTSSPVPPPSVPTMNAQNVPPTGTQAMNTPTSPPVPPTGTQAMNTQNIPPASPQAQPMPAQNTQSPPHPGHALPPLVETHSFGVNDPIIDDVHIEEGTPSADTLNAHPPASDSSRFGVRSSTISPGRRLRDKRYKRNSS